MMYEHKTIKRTHVNLTASMMNENITRKAIINTGQRFTSEWKSCVIV